MPYSEIIDRANALDYQIAAALPEETVKCDFCGGATPVSLVTKLDGFMDVCPVCNEDAIRKIQALFRDLNRELMNAVEERKYTEQDGRKWTGRISFDVLTEKIRKALEVHEQ